MVCLSTDRWRYRPLAVPTIGGTAKIEALRAASVQFSSAHEVKMVKPTDRSRSRSRRRPCGGKGTGSQPRNKKTDRLEISPWPTEDPTKHTQPWPKGLLHGKDDVIFAALAHVPRVAFESKQQLAIREALKLVGMGWVATNTKPYRMAMGNPAGKYIIAREIHEGNNWKKPAEPQIGRAHV